VSDTRECDSSKEGGVTTCPIKSIPNRHEAFSRGYHPVILLTLITRYYLLLKALYGSQLFAVLVALAAILAATYLRLQGAELGAVLVAALGVALALARKR
jgi:hypothetical protein